MIHLHIEIDENSLNEHYICVCIQLCNKIEIQFPRMQLKVANMAKMAPKYWIFAKMNMSKNML